MLFAHPPSSKTGSALRRVLFFAAVLCLPLPAISSEIVVLDFELKDLTMNPDTSGEAKRVVTLKPLLDERLKEAHQMAVLDAPASMKIESAKGEGYIFDRPAVAARLGREAGADWVLTGRLHKASFLFVYLKAQLIDVRTDKVEADFVVEIKGDQKKFTHKGIESLAVQVEAAVTKLDAED